MQQSEIGIFARAVAITPAGARWTGASQTGPTPQATFFRRLAAHWLSYPHSFAAPESPLGLPIML